MRFRIEAAPMHAELEPGARISRRDLTSAFSLRTPQRNRNEMGETTVNETCRKRLPQQEKSIT